MDQIYMLINNKIVDYIEYLSIYQYFRTGPLLK